MEGKLKVGFIGGGNMAFAMVKGFIKADKVKPENVLSSSKTGRTAKNWTELGCKATLSNQDVWDHSNIIFLAAKPYQVEEIFEDLDTSSGNKTIVSVVAGLSIFYLRLLIKSQDVRVLRCMPNTPCSVQEGAISLSGSCPSHYDTIKSMLTACGRVAEIPENLVNAFCGFAGSGSGFVLTMIEALCDAGVKQGLPRALAHEMAAQCFMGTGKLVRDSGEHPAVLKDEVTSPGGTTIAGLHELEKGGIRASIIGAVEKATQRANELRTDSFTPEKFKNIADYRLEQLRKQLNAQMN